MAHCLDTWIPILDLKGVIKYFILQLRILLNPAISLNYFYGIGGGHQDLREECIGVEGYGSQHLRKLFTAEFLLRRIIFTVLGLAVLRIYYQEYGKNNNKDHA